MRFRTILVAWVVWLMTGSMQATQPALAASGAGTTGLEYDFILASPQFPLARLAVDTTAEPPRLLGVGPRGEVYAINIYIGAPVFQRLSDRAPPPPPGIVVAKADSGVVLAARYAAPVTQGKAVVGWQALEVKRRSGALLTAQLPDTSLFSAQRPLLIDLQNDGLQEILTVRRDRDGSARMVVYFPGADTLTAVAETPPAADKGSIDPLGAADFEGKGQEQIALVSNPEGSGYLETYAFENGTLTRKWRLYGFSSRLPGAGREGVAVLADLNGDAVTDLLLPRNDLVGVAVMTMAGGYSRPLWRTEFTVPLATPFTVVPDGNGSVREVAFLLADGRLGVLERRTRVLAPVPASDPAPASRTAPAPATPPSPSLSERPAP